MKRIFFYCFAVAAVFTSCSSKQGMIDKIKEKETLLWADSARFQVNQDAAKELTVLYEKFAEAHPSDSLAPEYLFKQAEINRSLKQFDKSIATWQKIMDKYPGYAKAPHCLFLQGFVYENDLKDSGKAKERYEKFLQQYSNHELIDDVQFSLQNLGKSPEDIIREFEQKMGQDTTAQSS